MVSISWYMGYLMGYLKGRARIPHPGTPGPFLTARIGPIRGLTGLRGLRDGDREADPRRPGSSGSRGCSGFRQIIIMISIIITTRIMTIMI